MKRICALLLALIMILSLATTAFAAGTNTITVTKTKTGETYDLYKLFDLSVNEDLTAYTYTVNSAWTAFFDGDGKQYITTNDQGYVTDISDAAALAKAAEAYAVANTIGKIDSKVAAGENVVFENLENGYYLVTSTLGTIAMAVTTPDNPDATINEKNPENTISKQVQEDSDSSWGASNDAQIGDTVNFKTTINLIVGTRNVVVHDKMDSGLTLNADSIKIEGLTKGTDYTVKTTDLEDGCTFEVVIDDTYVNSLTANTTLTMTYSAVLNENAVVNNAIVDQKNVTKVTFGDAQTSVEATTTTTTHKFAVNKFAKDVENLADAVFYLKKAEAVVKLIQIDDNNYRVAKADEEGAVDTFTTVASDDIVIWGVDADDDYTLEEITAPAGYNKLPAEVKVTVNADNSTRVDVENKAGTELPSTGGVGTTMFYVIGGLMMLMAVVLLVTKKRMASAE